MRPAQPAQNGPCALLDPDRQRVAYAEVCGTDTVYAGANSGAGAVIRAIAGAIGNSIGGGSGRAYSRQSQASGEAVDFETVLWVEAFSMSLHLHQTPLSIAPIFTKQREGTPRAGHFTSATLAVKATFIILRHKWGWKTNPRKPGRVRSIISSRHCCTCPPACPIECARLHRCRDRSRSARD